MSLKRLVVGGRLVVRPDYLQAEYQSMRPACPDCAPPPGVRDCAPPAQRRWWEIAAHKARSPGHAGLVPGLPVTRGARSHLGVLLLTVTLLSTGASHRPGRKTPQLLPISMVVTRHTWQMMDRQHAKRWMGCFRSTSVLMSEQFCLAIMRSKH